MPTSRPPADQPHVEIEIRNGLACTAAIHWPQLAPILEFPVRHFNNSGPLGYSMTVGTDSLGAESNGRLIFPSGLVPRIVEVLESENYIVVVRDHSRWPQLESVDREIFASSELTNDDFQFLDAVQREPRSQIFVGSAADIPRRIALLGCLLPRTNQVVVARNLDEVRRLQRELPMHTDRPYSSDPDMVWPMRHKGLLCTPATYWLCRLEDFNVVIFGDSESALSSKSIEQFCPMNGALMYAFIHPDQRLSERQHLSLEASFGRAIIDESETSTRARTVHVVCGAIASDSLPRMTPLARKRAAFWCSARNSTIATIALAVARKDFDSLEGIGLAIGPNIRKVIRQSRHIAILVESRQHAAELLAQLPRWTRVDADDDLFWLASKNQRVVLTFSEASRVGLGADVIIRADGTATNWESSWGPHGSWGGPTETLVIDLLDSFDRLAVRESQGRLENYSSMGWSIRRENAPRPDITE